jgi:hypothetical protein
MADLHQLARAVIANLLHPTQWLVDGRVAAGRPRGPQRLVSTNRFQQIGFNKSGNLPGAVRHSSRIAAPADGPDAGGDVGAQIVESGTDDAGTSSLTRGCTGAHALVQVEKFT